MAAVRPAVVMAAVRAAVVMAAVRPVVGELSPWHASAGTT
jgi:hypothetical protein